MYISTIIRGCTRFRTSQGQRAAAHRGMSLLEVMIVLVIMVGVTAIVWPNLQKKLQRTTLVESAAMIREVLTETRYKASEQGQSFVVRLETGSNEFSVGSIDQFLSEPDFSPQSSTSGLASRSNSPGGSPSLASVSSSDRVPAGRLVSQSVQLKSLPRSVVISDVRWSESHDSSDSSQQSSLLGDTQSVNELGQSSSKVVGLPTAMGSELGSADIVAMTPHAFWLPILAGSTQGRDVTIRLTDTVVQQSIDVKFSSSTGTVEVVR